MLKARVIKSEGCHICKSYLKILSKQGYDYLIYDADVKENQKELDGWKITQMPVVQIVDELGKVCYQYPAGRHSTRLIDEKIKQLSKESKT